MRTLLFIAIAGFAAQLVDGGLGMGFGVTSTTLLINVAALTPAAASAVVHAAQVGTAAASGVSHLRFGNVNMKVLLAIGIPGAVGSFSGAMLLSHLTTEAARPITAGILAVIGAYLLIRFSRGGARREPNPKPYAPRFLNGLGLFGGFVAASGGGGWGPITTSTLLAMGRSEPRRVVGTVCAAEFLVSAAATVGFIVGLWADLVHNVAAVITLLLGGVAAAPFAAWLVSRVNAVALGGFVGTMLVALNIPMALGLDGSLAWTVRGVLVAVGATLSIAGVVRARRATNEHVDAPVKEPATA